ncbi:MAG TPA: cupin domain-containing protein [Xanthobacteraceae bacterium]|nr:cupin domain-containing protein [Xanthobacteraceae bacterium]
MRKPIRRVVTGHDAAGRSVFITDAPAPHVYNRAPGTAVVTELWETRAMPADNSGNDEVTDHPFRLAPPSNGSVFRIVEYPPDKERLPALERERAHSASEDARERADDTRPDPGSSARDAFDRRSPRHPGFHKTSSVDYAIVLAGEIYALMDEGEVLLRAGDVLVQRGTNHAWSNRSSEPARLAFVLIDATPV